MDEEPASVPGEVGDALGADRMAGVRRQREQAAAQIGRTLRVWRKASGEESEAKAVDGEEGTVESEKNEKGEDGEKQSEAEAGEEQDAAGDKGEAQAKVSAKLDGVGRKVFLAKKDKEEKLEVSEKVISQMQKAGLPYQKGGIPFAPKLFRNPRGDVEIEKTETARGTGWVDTTGRVWIRGRAHAGYPDHWDVQKNAAAGEGDYENVTMDGELMTKEHQNRGEKK